MQHGLETFVRLVRALLGVSAVAEAKTESGQAIVILGILVRIFPLECGHTYLHHLAFVRCSRLRKAHGLMSAA